MILNRDEEGLDFFKCNYIRLNNYIRVNINSMKSKLSFLSIIILVIISASCQNKIKWEYKTVYFDAEKIQSIDKSYVKGADFFKRTISSSTILPSDSSLNKIGIDGWEIATSYLEMETVFPNLLASGDGVSGLQPNIRPQRLVVIFKRPSQSK
jgi:hypothetical protein